MEYLFVAAGGALGSLIRYIIGKKIAENIKTNFPIGTFVINITGAILLGIVSTIKLDGNIYILIGDGFLGAYTTFSTFMYEGFNLLQRNKKINAVIYILSSLVLGIFGYFIGVELINFIN